MLPSTETTVWFNAAWHNAEKAAAESSVFIRKQSSGAVSARVVATYCKVALWEREREN